MQDNLNTTKSQMLTIKQFALKNPWPNESTLRNLYYRRKDNGMAKAFIKVGKRIIVDEEVFFKILKAQK